MADDPKLVLRKGQDNEIASCVSDTLPDLSGMDQEERQVEFCVAAKVCAGADADAAREACEAPDDGGDAADEPEASGDDETEIPAPPEPNTKRDTVTFT